MFLLLYMLPTCRSALGLAWPIAINMRRCAHRGLAPRDTELGAVAGGDVSVDKRNRQNACTFSSHGDHTVTHGKRMARHDARPSDSGTPPDGKNLPELIQADETPPEAWALQSALFIPRS